MRHVFLVAFLCFVAIQAQAQDNASLKPGAEVAAGRVQLVENDENGELLIFVDGVKVARCTAANQKIECADIAHGVSVVPAIRGQPAPGGIPTADGAP